jgi:carboxypeptidase PM20D1
MNASLFAVDTLIARGYTPKRDIYLAYSGNEEINGQGAPTIIDYFEKNNIKIGLVLDEGGAVVEGAFPGVTRPTAMIGIAEKGMIDLEYRVRSSGGHASAPKPRNPVAALASACCAVLAKPPKMHISKPISEMFDTLGRHSSFFYRMIFANLWFFAPILDRLAKKQGGDMNAMLRTTVAFTRMKGSDANNGLPHEASMVSNIRLNPADTVDDTIVYLRRVIDDPKLELRPILGTNPSRISSTDCEGYERLKGVIREVWPEAVISPYLMVQCSDSRHWGLLSDRVYRFSAMDLTDGERRSIHAKDEHVRVEAIARTVEFYLRLLKKS